MGCAIDQPPVQHTPEDRIEQALKYCRSNDMDTSICVLVDFNKHSGTKRMKVYDLKKKKALSQGLVCHGMGKTLSKKIQFSNVFGSHCSSLGKYKIGKRGWSMWGIHIKYELHGLEKTNSNAHKRHVVLHSWSVIPDKKTYPLPIAEGYGCPAVSNNYMKHLDKLLRGKKKDVLLWIYLDKKTA